MHFGNNNEYFVNVGKVKLRELFSLVFFYLEYNNMQCMEVKIKCVATDESYRVKGLVVEIHDL